MEPISLPNSKNSAYRKSPNSSCCVFVVPPQEETQLRTTNRLSPDVCIREIWGWDIHLLYPLVPESLHHPSECDVSNWGNRIAWQRGYGKSHYRSQSLPIPPKTTIELLRIEWIVPLFIEDLFQIRITRWWFWFDWLSVWFRPKRGGKCAGY